MKLVLPTNTFIIPNGLKCFAGLNKTLLRIPSPCIRIFTIYLFFLPNNYHHLFVNHQTPPTCQLHLCLRKKEEKERILPLIKESQNKI